MKLISILGIAIFLASCATNTNSVSTSTAGNKESNLENNVRTPATAGDLSGDYLAEGRFENRDSGVKHPALRIYLDRAPGEADTYYGVMVEYPNMLNLGMPLKYGASQKAPFFNKIIGYLNRISTRVWAFKAVRGQNAGSYELHNLEARSGQVVAAANASMLLNLDTNNINSNNPLAGATITGYSEGKIVIPSPTNDDGSFSEELQYNLASFVYKKAKLKSTWRGNWNDLEGSYLSEYGRVKDGVLELYSQNGQKRMKFIKTNRTNAKYFTNPKSAPLEGEYAILEPVPKMYVLVPLQRKNTASDAQMSNRIGLFLDVFDASAPEAGSHMVTELAFTNPNDPEDFMMYYEHADHLKNIGVEPPKK